MTTTNGYAPLLEGVQIAISAPNSIAQALDIQIVDQQDAPPSPAVEVASKIREVANLQKVVPVQESCCQKIKKWFLESGDPETTLSENRRPARWKRGAVIVVTSLASVGVRLVTDDPTAAVGASALSAVQVQSEMYDLPHKYKALVLAGMIGLSYFAESWLFPTVPVLKSVAISGLCVALAFRTITIETQKWMNIKAAQRR